MKTHTFRTAALGAAALALAAGSAPAQVKYTFTDLGTLPGNESFS